MVIYLFSVYNVPGNGLYDIFFNLGSSLEVSLSITKTLFHTIYTRSLARPKKLPKYCFESYLREIKNIYLEKQIVTEVTFEMAQPETQEKSHFCMSEEHSTG